MDRVDIKTTENQLKQEFIQGYGYRFLTFPHLKIVDVDFRIVSKEQKIVEPYRLKPRDAIHAACASIYCNGEIISSDSDFDIEDIKKH